ncbi:hypothetical protein E3U55_11645 [Filobacillus milosensis]|uniref:Uncharacterized protein n=1 Tax=Filobacillus milosensis TaxID=94137 RepID=A0A4Y8IFS5_9BACI|nr:hypothetical protein [Filobacillus milosensis]TFB18917.1 hypothetical protein E3U55_11645 [Filobacillus milosensis]
MNKAKAFIFYLVNVLIGVFSYYLFLFLWVAFSWGEPMNLLSLEAILTLTISSLVFLGFNYLLLRKINKPSYWGKALATSSATIITIILVIAYPF